MSSPDADGLGAGEVVVPDPLPPGRRAVLQTVHRTGGATARAVARTLGITVSGARQHLSALVDDGLVATAVIPRDKGAAGRRLLEYRVTERGDALFPKRYATLTTELLGYLADDAAGTVERLFARRRDDRIVAVRARLSGRTDLAERAAELARVFDEEGYLAGVEPTDGGLLLVQRTCAIAAVARRYPQACATELDLIRAVLPGAEVVRTDHVVAGAHRCAYLIRPVAVIDLDAATVG